MLLRRLALQQLLQRYASTASSSSVHNAAAAATAGMQPPLLVDARGLSSSAAAQGPAAAEQPQLTEEQQQHLRTLRHLVARPLEGARNAALLTGLAAAYRDLYAVMDLMHKKDILGIPHPLLDELPQQQQQAPGGQQQQQQPVLNRTQMFFPIRDFTLLPDAPPPAGGWLRNHLNDRYMTRITAFAQLLPNHLEVSYQARAQVFLWPPMEAYFPGFMDVDGLMRHLRPSAKRQRRPPRPSRLKQRRCRLGWARRKPYHAR